MRTSGLTDTRHGWIMNGAARFAYLPAKRVVRGCRPYGRTIVVVLEGGAGVTSVVLVCGGADDVSL